MTKYDFQHQESLLGHEVLECTLKVGFVVDTDHAQVEAEVRNAATGDLVWLTSIPHTRITSARQQAQWFLAEMIDAALEDLAPF